VNQITALFNTTGDAIDIERHGNKPVTVVADAGHVSVDLCKVSRMMDNLNGPDFLINVTANQGRFSLNLHDQANGFGDTYAVTGDAIKRPFFTGVRYTGSAANAVKIMSGAGRATFNVDTTSAAHTQIDTGPGGDLVNVGRGSLDGVRSVGVNGGGAAVVTADDSAANASRTYTVHANGFAGPTGGTFVGFQNVGSAALKAGAVADTVNVERFTTAAPPISVDGGGGTDLLRGDSFSAHDWTIGGADAGSLRADDGTSPQSTVNFTSVGCLIGGDGTDTYRFTQFGSLSGWVMDRNGGPAGNTDRLDYSACLDGVQVDLRPANGTASRVGGGQKYVVTGVEHVTGGWGGDRIWGDDGWNILEGGPGGNDVLVGRGGVDELYASNTGRCVLIGGTGADYLYGGSADDILLNGTTAYENDPAALNDLMATWSRTDLSFQQRVQALDWQYLREPQVIYIGGTTYSMPGVVFSDGSRDTLVGGGGENYFGREAVDSVS
jgi:hypothetical protein